MCKSGLSEVSGKYWDRLFVAWCYTHVSGDGQVQEDVLFYVDWIESRDRFGFSMNVIFFPSSPRLFVWGWDERFNRERFWMICIFFHWQVNGTFDSETKSASSKLFAVVYFVLICLQSWKHDWSSFHVFCWQKYPFYEIFLDCRMFYQFTSKNTFKKQHTVMRVGIFSYMWPALERQGTSCKQQAAYFTLTTINTAGYFVSENNLDQNYQFVKDMLL